MRKKLRLPSPALVLAGAALFVATTGTAAAVTAAAVPLAKRALLADNALKLEGKSASALAQQAASQAAAVPGPASTAAGLLSQKTGSGQISPDGVGTVSVSCDSGKKITGAGFSVAGVAIVLGSQPTGDTGWTFTLLNLSETNPATVTAYGICIG